MLSKFLRTTYKTCPGLLLRKIVPKTKCNVRYADMLPASQYDIPFPRKLKLGYTLSTYWELIPLFVSTTVGMIIMVIAIIWAFGNKVDCVYSTHNRDNISRTMDLRNPTVHKMILINQRYEPWPEMQDVLDKMRMAEKRALMRLQSCSNP